MATSENGLNRSTGAERLARLRAALQTQGLAGLLVTGATNRRYVTGFTGTAGAALITAERAWLFVDFRYTEQAGQQAPDFTVVQYGDFHQTLQETAAGALKAGPIGVESVHLTMQQWQELGEKLPDGVWRPVTGVVEALRAVKEPVELRRLQRAIDLADETFAHLVHWLRPGLTEKEVAFELEWTLKRAGAEALAFPSIVASGPRSSLPHAVPTDRRIERGDLLTLDFGAVWEGYHSDITRTVCVGPPAAKQREVYDLVLRAQQAGIAAVRPGPTGKEVDAVARAVIEQAGYGERFGHNLGHGVGLDVHEDPPRLSQKSEAALQPDMVTSVEPGVYIPGWGGIRIEDLVLVTEDGRRVLTRSPKDLIAVGQEDRTG